MIWLFFRTTMYSLPTSLLKSHSNQPLNPRVLIHNSMNHHKRSGLLCSPSKHHAEKCHQNTRITFITPFISFEMTARNSKWWSVWRSGPDTRHRAALLQFHPSFLKFCGITEASTQTFGRGGHTSTLTWKYEWNHEETHGENRFPLTETYQSTTSAKETLNFILFSYQWKNITSYKCLILSIVIV